MPALVVMQHRTFPHRCGFAARRGFTLIDVLVSMAVIAVLISLLSPSLSTVRETAHQVVCRSNMRQCGMGVAMYADQHKDIVPRAGTLDPRIGKPWDTMYLRFADDPSLYANQWDGLGILYGEEYLGASKIFYCPSHHGNNPYRAYESSFDNPPGAIIGNYQYRGRGSTYQVTHGPPAPETTQLSRMVPQTALVSDGMRTQEDFNHVVGANVLRAGLSVVWFPDSVGLFRSLPKDGQPHVARTYQDAWGDLDGAH